MAQGVVLHQVIEIRSVFATALTVAPSRVSVLFSLPTWHANAGLVIVLSTGSKGLFSNTSKTLLLCMTE